MATILNRQKVLNRYILDIDIYDRPNVIGETLAHVDANAVNNAIMLYLVSKKGSYVYKNDFGSPLDILEFKNLDLLAFSDYSQRIASQIENNFGRYISDVSVALVPNYDTRTIEVNFQYTSLLENTLIKNSVVKKINSFKYQDQKSYVEINLDSVNLLNWLELELLNQPKSTLIYNPSIQSWVWSIYKLSTLGEPATKTWQDVQTLIFNYNTQTNTAEYNNGVKTV